MTGDWPDSTSSLPSNFSKSKYGCGSGGPWRDCTRAVTLRSTPRHSGAMSSTMPTFSTPPTIIQSTRLSIASLSFLPLRKIEQLLLRPDFHFARAQIDRLQAIGAGETRINAAQRDGHIGDLLIFNHGRHALQVLIRGCAHAPAAGAIVLAGNDKVMALAAWRFDRRQSHAPDGQFIFDFQLQRAVFHPVEALPDDLDRLEDFLHAHDNAAPHVGTLCGDDVKIDAVISGIRMVAAAIDIDSGSAGDGPEKAKVLHSRFVGNADVAGALLNIPVVTDGMDHRAPLGFELVEHSTQFGPQGMSNVAAHASDQAQGVGLAVAADFLRHPHDGLADAETLHEERVEAHDVASETNPEQVTVQPLEFQHDGANVLGARRRLQRGGLFDGLHVGHVVHAAADPADALRQHRNVVVAHHGLGQFLDAAMDHEAAILAAAHHFAFDVKAEVGGFVERRMKRTERNHGAAFGRLAKLEFPIFVVAVGHFIPGEIFAQRMPAFRPAVRQDQALGITVAYRLDAEQVAHFALGPSSGWNHAGDAVDGGIVWRDLRKHAAQHVVLVERKIVGDQKVAGEGPVIAADAGDVAGIQFAEDVLAHVFHNFSFHEDEQTIVAGQVGALDEGSKPGLELLEHFARDHECPLAAGVFPGCGCEVPPSQRK